MPRVKDRDFWESANFNNDAFQMYYNLLTELAVSMFKWTGLPEEIDKRALELALFGDGKALFFRDKDGDFYATTRCTCSGSLDLYGIPTERRAFAPNGYNKVYNRDDSVVIYNNLLRTNSVSDIEYYARRLWDIDRTIDVNVKAQKTPIVISCDDTEKLTLKNIYKQYDGNAPVIFAYKSLKNKPLSVLKTDAPYLAGALYDLRTNIMNEALTYLGISNTNFFKKERLLDSEVARSQGGTIACRFKRLEARRQACEKINKMFGLDVWCDYQDMDTYFDSTGVAPDADRPDFEKQVVDIAAGGDIYE